MSIQSNVDFIGQCDLLLDNEAYETYWEEIEQLQNYVKRHACYSRAQLESLQSLMALNLEDAHDAYREG